MAEEKNSQKKPLSLEERLVEKSIKSMEKVVGEQTETRLQAGQQPQQIVQELLKSVSGQSITSQDVLNQLNTLASQSVPQGGTRTGVLPALIQAIGGEGFHPMAPKQAPLGMEKAAQVMQLQQGMQQQAGQIPKTQTELLKNLLEIAKTTGNEQLYQAAGGQINQNMDWRTGQLTPEAEAEKRALITKKEIRTKFEEETNQKRELLAKELDNYFAVGDVLPTEEGLGRFRSGAKLFGKAALQLGFEGAAAADLNKINKKLRVTLVRAAGDVGNLNIVEQQAAEELLFNLSDSTKLRQLKKAFLADMVRAVGDNSTSEVKKIIGEYVETPEFKEKNKGLYEKYQSKNYKDLNNIKKFSSEKEALASGVKGEVMIGGRRAVID